MRDPIQLTRVTSKLDIAQSICCKSKEIPELVASVCGAFGWLPVGSSLSHSRLN